VTTRRDLSKLDPRTAALVAADVPVARLQAAAASFAPGDPASVLVGNAPKRAATLAAAGIATVADVLALDAGTGAVPKVAGLVDMIDASRAQKVGKVLRARGVSKLSLPRADIEVDVDMENDSTLNEEDNELGVVYLWGTLTTVRCKGFSLPGNPYRAFSTFAAGDREGEAKAFADMWGWLQSLITLARTEGLTFRSYCYTGAENRIMRHLAKKHHGRFPGVPSLAEVEAFVASEHWVDLYTVVERQLVWPTENRSIKSIAKWARHSWRDSDANGANSVVWYHEACQGYVQAQQRLLDYNEDDVLATFRVREWLDSLCASRASDRLPAAESLDRRFARSR
jgi:predicted RecB family nuclease